LLFTTTITIIIAPDTTDALERLQPGGSLQFYPNADAQMLFGERDILGVSFANKNGICAPLSNSTGKH